MTVQHAKEVAREWVFETGSVLPGFVGAYYHGSINWLAGDATLPANSDVDVMVVLADPGKVSKLGKFLYRDVLLEVSYLPSDQIQSAQQVLAHYQIAPSVSATTIILDTTGHLTALQATVARDYAQRQWVYKRCEHAKNNVLDRLELNESARFHEQVMAWLFATGITTHILLVAGLRNPTVRRRYLATRELLADYDQLSFYETLLEMAGYAHIRRERVEYHLTTLGPAFDAACSVLKTPYPFAADMTDTARPVAIDGSREMIQDGYHREALFWITAVYSRCQSVLHQDATPAVQEHFSGGYRELLLDLGVESFADLQRRGEQVRAFLPRVWEVAESIIATNPAIRDD